MNQVKIHPFCRPLTLAAEEIEAMRALRGKNRVRNWIQGSLASLTAGLMLTLAVGCNNTDKPATGTGGTVATNGAPTGSGGGGANGNPVTGDTIPVGAYNSMTGSEADFGKSSFEGEQLAVEQINAQGGIKGKKIVLKNENDESDAAKATSVVTKLITSDKVVAVVGEVASSRSIAAAPVCQDNKIPMISPSSTNVTLTQKGDYIFRVCFIDSFQAYVLAKFAHDTLKATNAAMFIESGSAYSEGFGQEFKKAFEGMGGKVVAEKAYATTDTDFKGPLTSIKTANAQAILVPGYYKSAGAIGKQAKELGITAPLLGGDGWDSQDLFKTAGAALSGAYFSDHMDISSAEPTVKSFVEAYKKKFGAAAQPGALTALGYDSTMILADAMKRASALDGPSIREALTQTKDFPGVTGKITINKDRNADKPAVVLQIANQQFKYVTTIQQPQ